ncbi:MAG: D-alanyl-D-alanine carboxypeptidase family protein [Desulfitobacteriaceae bacterium]
MFRAMRTLAWGSVFLCILGLLIPVCGPVTNVWAETKVGENIRAVKPTVSADAAVLLDVATGDVLYDKQAHKKRAPASTTKIMTAILGLELGRPEEVVTVSQKAAGVGESTLHLDPGEKIILYELITGALVKSGNDACVAIAEQIAGSEEKFVNLMNQKALLLGATDTHFANPNGLPNKDHYSSAYDLAMMARYGLQLPAFSSIIRQKETEIHFLEPDVMMDLRNTNKLLWSYPYADGVKTGTTNAAGKCLVASATRDGRQLVAVVLQAPNRFGDAQKLLEWGFNNTETYTLAQAGEIVGEFPLAGVQIGAVLSTPLQVTIPKEEKAKLSLKVVWVRPPTLPVQSGEILGRYEVWAGEKRLMSVPLHSERGVEKDLFGRIKN